MERFKVRHGEGGHESLVDRMQPYTAANSEMRLWPGVAIKR